MCLKLFKILIKKTHTHNEIENNIYFIKYILTGFIYIVNWYICYNKISLHIKVYYNYFLYISKKWNIYKFKKTHF